jgi:DNA-binding winged helix-turn-helix (wHTH) protein/Tol biopolymer transport system component
MSDDIQSRYHFGEFELSPAEHSLKRGGKTIDLAPKEFKALLLLAEQGGTVVEKDTFLKEVWDDAFVGDGSLTRTISVLRKHIGPDAIETVPRLGYRFALPVTKTEPADHPPAAASPARQGSYQPQKVSYLPGKRTMILAGTAITALSLALLITWWRSPPSVPYVDEVIQLTSDGQNKQGDVVTDGSRICFNEGEQGNVKIAQVSVNGGPTALIDTRLVNPQILAMAPDNSSLLVLSGNPTEHGAPLWSVPLPVGEPRRLGDLTAFEAGYFPDGRILVSRDGGLYAADSDGSQPRLVLRTKDIYLSPTVSPDGRHIAFTRVTQDPRTLTVYFGAADGKDLRAVSKGSDSLFECCAAWTPDGKGLIFQVADQSARNKNSADLWFIPVKARLFHNSPDPVRLTNGQLSYSPTNIPALSRDGSLIYAILATSRGELDRYDMKSNEFVGILSGISATDPTFSRDGQWVAYLSYPDDTLWRSRADGTDRMQLTNAPLVPTFPFISPDGMQVVFTAGEGGAHLGDIYVVGTDGSPPHRIVQGHAAVASWSPDGNLLVLNSWTGDGGQFNPFLEIYDMRTGKRSTVPSSQEMYGPLWAGQDTLVAAVFVSNHPLNEFRTFNFKTRKWNDLFHLTIGSFVNWMTTMDAKYLYATTDAADAPLLRIRLSDGHTETITSLKNFRRLVNAVTGYTQVNVAPDGSAVFTRDIGAEEIYALKLRWR